jgi:lipoyl-dependent peroxiredoxin
MIRTASANWKGNLKEGKGILSTQSGVLSNTNYSFKTRFEDDQKGTNPEELLAVAHAGCFTMAVSAMLTEKGFTAENLNTEAFLRIEGLTIESIHLKIAGNVPNVSASEFETITKSAEANCLISKVLKIQISSEAKLII